MNELSCGLSADNNIHADDAIFREGSTLPWPVCVLWADEIHAEWCWGFANWPFFRGYVRNIPTSSKHVDVLRPRYPPIRGARSSTRPTRQGPAGLQETTRSSQPPSLRDGGVGGPAYGHSEAATSTPTVVGPTWGGPTMARHHGEIKCPTRPVVNYYCRRSTLNLTSPHLTSPHPPYVFWKRNAEDERREEEKFLPLDGFVFTWKGKTRTRTLLFSFAAAAARVMWMVAAGCRCPAIGGEPYRLMGKRTGTSTG
jgi:hypothetical protein